MLHYLQPQAGESFLDLTAGWGGHAAAVLELTAAPNRATLVDRDPQAVQALRRKFPDVAILQTDFLAASQKLLERGRRYNLILADLGVSSPQLEQPQRGFSFQQSGPLDMRMDPDQNLTASDIVNRWDEAALADLIYRYGEDRRSRAIARAIVANRPLTTTKQLADIIQGSFRVRSRIQPATKTFQALRIAVNDELNQLAGSLPNILQLLSPGGRAAVISFHSLEDRLVKQAFKEAADQGYETAIRLLTKKPVTAPKNEIVLNPRARSAKLRAVAKIKK